MPDEFDKRADAITTQWFEHLESVNQLDTPLRELAAMYWAMLDSAIAAALRDE